MPPRRRGRRSQRRARGSIVQRGPNRFLIRWHVGADPVTGKRRYVARTIQGTRAEALRQLAHELSQVRPEAVNPSELGGYLTRWLEDIVRLRVSERTLHSYRKMLAKVTESGLGTVRLDRVRTEEVQALYVTLSRELSPRTVRYVHVLLKAALDHAVRSRIIGANPVRNGLTLPRHAHSEPRVWTAEQAHVFLDAVKAHPRLSQDYALWTTLFYTGLRPGEAAGLQWGDLDGRRLRVLRSVVETEQGHFAIAQPKTERGRRGVVLTAENAALLESLRGDSSPEAFIFPACNTGTRPKQRHTASLQHDYSASMRARFENAVNTVNEARVEAELPPLPRIRLYDLRHSHATALLRAGIHPKIVSERLGHASVVITLNTYSHALPTLQEDAVAVFERSLPSAQRTQPPIEGETK